MEGYEVYLKCVVKLMYRSLELCLQEGLQLSMPQYINAL
jgi:hypothetical protein